MSSLPGGYGVEGRDDHEGDLDDEEETDHHDEHHGGTVGVPLLAVPAHPHPRSSEQFYYLKGLSMDEGT